MARNDPRQPKMTPEELAAAPAKLGITVEQLSVLLGFAHPQHLKRQMHLGAEAHWKEIAPSTVRLVQAYLAGYKPADWPGEKKDATAYLYNEGESSTISSTAFTAEQLAELDERVKMLLAASSTKDYSM